MCEYDQILRQLERFEWLREELCDGVHDRSPAALGAVLFARDSRLPEIERALVSLALLGTPLAGELLWQWEPRGFPPRIALLHRLARREWHNRHAAAYDDIAQMSAA
jgi:hypothetical protein